MPINSPPPAQPPVFFQGQAIAPIQQQNPWAVNYTDKNNSESNSKSENVVSQSASQTNVNNNYSNLNYLQGRYGVRIPSEWSFNANSNYTSDGVYVQSFGVSYTPQGKNKRIIQRTLDLDNMARQASICAGLTKDGIMIDYTIQPQFSFCNGFNRYQPVADNVHQEYLLAIKKQQATIQALLKRIDEMQSENSTPFNTPG